MKWSKLHIPSYLSVAPKREYEVVFIDAFKPEPLFGETRYDTYQIVLATKQGVRETALTLFHEFLHAVSHEHGVGLTEAQISDLESTFPYFDKFFKAIHEKK